MKKRISLLPLLFLLLCAVLISAMAAGGDSSDPLVSLSYLNSSYLSTVETAVNQKLDAADQKLSDSAQTQLKSAVAAAESALGGNVALTWTEAKLNAGDVLSGSTGLSVLALAGKVQVSFSAGAVVDVSTGKTVSTGTVLTTNHRYLVAEDTMALFTVASKTAVLDYQGPYGLTKSTAIDYTAMATGLKTLHLFRGSYTGYGDGYDLEVAPTRIQALIMFIRILGEEEAALSFSGKTPFRDIAAGSLSEKYVSYAYAKGYTNGYTATTFQPNQTISANQYLEFMLRALGYSSASNTNLTDTMERALSCGLITAGEQAILRSAAFLRADLVYVSYYALDTAVAGSDQTLRQTLLSQGVFTTEESTAAAALVSSNRIF